MINLLIRLKHCSVYTQPNIVDLVLGAQPALHFGGGNFHELSFNDVMVLIQP